MSTFEKAAARPGWLRSLAVAVAIACVCLILSTASALAQSAPPSPTPAASGEPRLAELNMPIDPDLLESLQQSIVGVVTVWEESEDPFQAMFGSVDPATHTGAMPVISVCTGWFDTPTTIVTAGHCVDPKEGRLALDLQTLVIDPATGRPVPPAAGRPDPKRTVSVYQPHELAGRVITEPTIARVNNFRPAGEGDIARLDVFGLPPAKPLAVAPNEPRLGEAVTAIGFPGINFSATDGFDIKALLGGGKSAAEILQDSRLQPVSTSGTITSRQYRHGVAVLQTNVDFAGGMSGGPTMNARGEVYGINSQMTVWGQNFNIVTNPKDLRDYPGHIPLGTQGDPTKPPVSAPGKPISAPDSAPATGSAIVISLMSAVAGAMIGGLAPRIVRRTRRNASKPVAGGRKRPPNQTRRHSPRATSRVTR